MNKEGAVDCQEVVERLPWLLNGTLEGDEAARVRSHLDSCAACRGEVGETRWAAAVFGAHPSAETLVALAWERPGAEGELESARRHLEACPACTEELELARESRRLETAVEPARRPARTVPWAVRYGPLAAAALVVVAVGGLWRADQVRLTERVAELQEDVRRLRDTEDVLRETLERLESPEPNLPVVEVLPDTSVSRSATSASTRTRIVVPAGARFVALLLGSEKGEGPASVDLRAASGEVLWTGRNLVPNALGGYTLGLPARLLADGTYTLTLRPARGPAETYTIVVERGRP